MKNTLLFFLLITASISLRAQVDIPANVASALQKGDATALAACFLPTVELSLNGSSTTISKEEAQVLLTAFFKTNAVSGYNSKHQGSSKLDDQFRVGELLTASGPFRVTFFVKKQDGVSGIRQIKIEKSN